MKTIHDSYFDLCKKHVVEKDRDIVLLQVGSFYEAYSSPEGYGCAELLSEALNLTLTRKSTKHPFSKKNPKMSGLPLMNLERHLNLLLDNNFRVVIYEQNPDNVKERIYRGCFTKNIRMDFPTETSLNIKTEKKVYSIFLEKYHVNRNRIKINQYKLSFAYLELNTAKIYLSETIDDHYVRMVEQFMLQHQPDELLFHVNANVNEEEKIEIATIFDRKFEFKTIDQPPMMNEMETIIIDCFSKYPSDLFMYPESILNIYKIIKHIVEYDPIQTKNLICEDNPWLSMSKNKLVTFNRDLFKELFIFDLKDERSEESKKIYRSIFDLLSNSMNSMGKRQLARILNSPLTCPYEIEERLSLIDLCEMNRKIYQDLIDFESYYIKWTRSTLHPKMVAKCLLAYKNISDFYPSLLPFLKFIESVWNLESMSCGEEYFLSPSSDYQKWCDDYQNIVNKFQNFEFKNANLNFVFNKEDSYFIIQNTKWNKLTSDEKENFRIISSKNVIKHIMVKDLDTDLFLLVALGNKIETYKKNYFHEISMKIFQQYNDFLLNFNKTVANDSMYSVLKVFFQENAYSKPILKKDEEYASFEIENVRHPLLEKLFPDDVFVPFSANLNTYRNGHLIYGLNRSGKSTFMKSIATSIYLAQCGLYTPCTKLELSPYHSVYSKLNHSDNLFKKQSLFFNEINEIKYILKRIHSQKSLLFLDELFQGTEIASTIGLLIGIIHSFVQKNIQFFLSTHIHLISDVIEKEFKKRIRISHFEMNDINLLHSNNLVSNSANIFYNRKLKEGSGNPIYGIEIASQLQLPDEIIQIAKSHRQHVTIEYNFKQNKISKYNKNIVMNECTICKSRKNLQVHHIYQQKHFDLNKNNNGFTMNNKQNLIVVCFDCHRNIESS